MEILLSYMQPFMYLSMSEQIENAKVHFDGLVQHCSANALELLQ